MNIYLKQFLIILTTFFLILWFQDCDDNKKKKQRKSYYDRFKLPTLVCAMLGLILNFNEIFNDETVEEEIVIIKPKIQVPKSILKSSKNIPSKNNFSDM